MSVTSWPFPMQKLSRVTSKAPSIRGSKSSPKLGIFFISKFTLEVRLQAFVMRSLSCILRGSNSPRLLVERRSGVGLHHSQQTGFCFTLCIQGHTIYFIQIMPHTHREVGD